MPVELRKDGLAVPPYRYKVYYIIKPVSGIRPEDDKGILLQNISTSKPAFFGAALRDYVALATPNSAPI
ncbi:hypothetical protein Moror_9388 [Moniliophthora roreri MCA 2997]|uniref:Uncharacterized protein n=1 Tax=Moniliophthora roreri (strain MCA 2997) TaxID=1381753 RepID=V2WWU4_MONRO|nr:hypothetical protein Moror_9388 [Moniliophthora roreri MCA 2997]